MPRTPMLTPLAVRAFRRGDTGECRALAKPRQHILAVDPGASGMAVWFPPREEWQTAAPPPPLFHQELHGFTGLDALAVGVQQQQEIEGGRLLVVVEETFAGGRRNSGTDLQLARFAGAAIGAIAARLSPDVFDVVLVPPSMWLSAITKATGRGTKRQDRKDAARAFAIEKLGRDAWALASTRAAHREAFADCYGIATWWGERARLPIAVQMESPALAGVKGPTE